jgi:ribonuclease HI
MSQALEIYIDGASRGNPGPSGIGVIICRQGEVLKNISESVGNTTNNIAEYKALIYALEEALIIKPASVIIYSDSQLLCRQINGQYKVRDPEIAVLFRRATQLISALGTVKVSHIPREENRGADKLAGKGVKI